MVVISILVWDTPEYAENLLHNLFIDHPVGETPHRVYVLDQGSGWKTRLVLWRYRKHVRLLRVKQNIGFPAGHNLVLKTATEEGAVDAFCVLNSDVRFLEDNWLDALARTLKGDAKHAIAGPIGIRLIPRGDRRGHGELASDRDMESGAYDVLSGCVALIRASTARKHGLYDEVFTPGYFEDSDLGYRYHAAGYTSAYCRLKMEHSYLGPRTSTAKTHKDVLLKNYGNFREQNRQCFIQRWGHLLASED